MTKTGRRFAIASLLPLCAVLGLLGSCAPMATNRPQPTEATGPISTVNGANVNGVHYATAAAAVDALRGGEEGYVAQVTPEADPIKGTVRIILPDHDRLRPLVAQNFAQVTKRIVTGAALDFLIDEFQVGVQAAADAVVKAGEFSSASVVVQNDVLNPEQGDADYLVWYQVRTILPNNTGAWLGHWVVRRRGNPAEQFAAFDVGTKPGGPRYDSFVKSVRAAALRLGGRSRSGTTQSSLPAGAGGVATIGSGFIVDTKGHILTNEHVVRSCDRPKVTDVDGHSYQARVAARDASNDLALLSASHHWPDAATLRDGREPRPGDAVVVTGFPYGGLISSNVTVTTGSLSALTGPRDDTRLLQLSAPVQPGNSGGPVLDESGRVIGVVSESLNGVAVAVITGALPQNVNFAIKSAIIRNFLDTRQIDYAHAAPGHDLTSGDVGDLARKFTVRVACGTP
jgi:S1-C subfamily serine protease